MKKRMKRVVIAFAVLACFFDWPVTTNAVSGKAVVKSCSKLSKATKEMKKEKEALKKLDKETPSVNPVIGRTIYQNGKNNNGLKGTACTMCGGSGSFNGSKCIRCGGTGRR